jgi:DNA-binding IclR family transcriptional regulator
LSAPVFDHHGQLLATVSLAIPEIRYQDTTHRHFCIKKLLETARALSRVMGYESDESAARR